MEGRMVPTLINLAKKIEKKMKKIDFKLFTPIF